MSKVFLFLFICVTGIWIYFLWSRRRFYKVYWKLGGPLGLPFIGLGLKMMKPEKFLQYMQIKGEDYKTPFISWMGTTCFLYVNDPDTIETIFNSSCCTNKGDLYRFMASAIGDGLFTSSSPRWNKHRRFINPAFSRQVIHTFLPIFNQEANLLLKKFIMTKDKPIEIYEILKRCVLETACQTTMGQKMNFQNDGSSAIFDSYNSITELCVRRMLSPWLYPDIVYTNSSLFKQQQKSINVLYTFVENLLQSHHKTISLTESAVKTKEKEIVGSDHVSESKDREFKKSKFPVFINQVQKHIEEGSLTWKDVRDEANVIVAATFETTSTALYIVCLCLAMHPEYQEKLYSELEKIFPTDENKDLILDDITLEDLERMTYTEMVINEAMRLFAPVPIVLRRASCDFKLNNGILIPKDTQICIDIFNMQRSKNVWGSNACSFLPDTHFEPTAKPHPFAFIPFTKGLRMCIGYRYAIMLMKVMVAKIFRNFRIHSNAKMDDLIIKGTISLKFCQYPMCELQQRKFCNEE